MKDITFEALDIELGSHAPFMISLTDGEELKIVISASSVGESAPHFEESNNLALHKILENCRPIEPNGNEYEICFEDYIIYQVRNESYCSFDSDEIRLGKYLIVFEESKLLSHLGAVTDAQKLADGTYYPSEWKHYGIYTQNHVVDVVSCNAPCIKRL